VVSWFFTLVVLGLAARRQVDRDVTRTRDTAAGLIATVNATNRPTRDSGPSSSDADTQAVELARSAGAAVALLAGDRVILTSLSPGATRDLSRLVAARLPPEGAAVLGGERFAFRRAHASDRRSGYVLASIAAHTADATRHMLNLFAAFAIGTLLLVFGGGLWIVRAVTTPLRHLSASIDELASTRSLRAHLTPTGDCREIDAFTETLNHWIRSLSAAEREAEHAYTSAIRALAAAVDARSADTIGHSDRVSALAVTIGQTMGLSDGDLEGLRLGALLHDIGKIGVPDAILRKPEPLTESEQAQVKQHPLLGARILRSVPFLRPHIPIVELHHERPDGQGYPYGLHENATPLVARIVHVADAYDAMTSSRPYRPRQSDASAMTELWRYAGSEFDAEVVEACARSPRPLARAEAEDALPVPKPADPEPIEAALV
jgi:putative nucleotidyltransferase with HDIG domain